MQGATSLLAFVKRHQDYLITFVTEFAVMASQVLVYKLAARHLQQEGFAEYALARRAAALIYPICLLGLGVALPRYVGHALGQENPEEGGRYFAATLWSSGFAVLLFSLLLCSSPGRFAYLFFGQKQYAGLISGVNLVAVGVVIHSLVYGYFRGQMAFNRANTLQFINMAVVPPIVLVMFSKNVQMVLLSLGAATLAIAAVALLFFTPWQLVIHRNFNQARELLQFGLKRIPGDFAMIGLVSLPAIAAAHLQNVRKAGMVAFGISMVNLVVAMVAPVGLILLPKVSKRIGQGQFHELRREILSIAWISVAVPLGMFIIVELMGSRLIGIYLGPEFQSGVNIIQVLILGAFPLSFYSAMRSVLDAFHKRAVNTGNLMISLAVCGGCLTIGWKVFHAVSAELWAFVTGTAVLGLLTVLELLKILKIKPSQEHVAETPENVCGREIPLILSK